MGRNYLITNLFHPEAVFRQACITVIMAERRPTELPGKGESSDPQDSGARQGSPQRPPHPHQQGPGAISLVSDRPTIIFGADVTHPHPRSSPSIAAVVASQDWPEIKKYVGLVCPQAHGQELIQDLHHSWQHPNRGTVSGGMIKELLISFCKSTGQKPQRIIFYRNGVSEEKFYQVLLFELDAIREACASLEPNYHPQVTFVMVQKSQDTWLFANNHHDRNSDDRSGNILPGSAVDPKIWHPAEFNFFLCSEGTSPSVQYHILWDENMFSVDELQSFSNNLRYTDSRRRTFADVQPAVYAHHAASQASFIRGAETSGAGGGRGRGRGGMRAANAFAAGKAWLVFKDVKRVTFHC